MRNHPRAWSGVLCQARTYGVGRVFPFEKFHSLRVGEKEEIKQVKGQSGNQVCGQTPDR